MKVLDRIIGRFSTGAAAAPSSRPSMRYLRDTRTGVIQSRLSPVTESRDEIRRVWRRTAGLALDLIQNSGRLKGAVDQVLADTVGVELTLNPKPDLSALGYDAEETAAWVRLVKAEWKRYAWNPAECDYRGKFTVPQMVDIGLRWYIAYGEVTGILDYMPAATRRRYGIATGTKLCLTPPHRLVQDTNDAEGLYQGIYHDENGRPAGYLFEEREAGILRRRTYPARDADGRAIVMHIFDPSDATDVRGISVLASAFRKHIQHEMLDDATLQTAILQTIFAAVLTSDKPSAEAFEAIEALKDSQIEGAKGFAADMIGYLSGSLDKAAESSLVVSPDPQVSHLAPGEDFDIKTARTPGGQYLPFSASLSRDMARAIGITYGGLTMDHTDATYSSVRMENSSIWPVVMRRRERIAAPICQSVYEPWLEEKIATGRIPLKGGYRAFLANRDRVTWTQWQGPAKPSADDLKSAKASSEKIANGTTSLARECAELGTDPDELFEERVAEHKRYVDAGMRSPFDRATPGAAGNDNSDVEDDPKPKVAAQ